MTIVWLVFVLLAFVVADVFLGQVKEGVSLLREIRDLLKSKGLK